MPTPVYCHISPQSQEVLPLFLAEIMVKPALEVRVNKPHAGLESFAFAVRSLRDGFPHAAHLAWRFFLRDTQADFRQSLLGYVWLLAPPLATTFVWVFLNRANLVRVGNGGIPYPVFVITGTVLWTAFNGSIMAMLSSIGPARGFMAKVQFPHESLIYSGIIKAALDAAVASVLTLPALVIYHIPWHTTAFLFPVALVASLIVGASLGLFLLPIATLYSDVARGIQLILRFGFFLTPIAFPLPAAGIARKLMTLNPLTPVVLTGRGWLTGTSEGMPVAFIGATVGCAVLAAMSLIFFKVVTPHLIERLGE